MQPRLPWAYDEQRAKTVSMAGTLIAAVLILGANALAAPDSEQAAGGCSADPTLVPSVIFPRSEQRFVAGHEYVFVIAPVEGATALRWHVSQSGVRVAELEEPWDSTSHLWRQVWWSYVYGPVARRSHFSSSDLAARPAWSGIPYVIEKGTAAHSRIRPGELSLQVRAQVCGEWTSAGRVRVHVTCPPVAMDERVARPPGCAY